MWCLHVPAFRSDSRSPPGELHPLCALHDSDSHNSDRTNRKYRTKWGPFQNPIVAVSEKLGNRDVDLFNHTLNLRIGQGWPGLGQRLTEPESGRHAHRNRLETPRDHRGHEVERVVVSVSVSVSSELSSRFAFLFPVPVISGYAH